MKKHSEAEIQNLLNQIKEEKNPSLQIFSLGSLIRSLFLEKGYDIIIYGGGAVEYYTSGGYSTRDLDFGFINQMPSLEIREEIFTKLGSPVRGRVRFVAGLCVDMGSVAEILSPPAVAFETPLGILLIERAEECLIGRIVQGTYPQKNEDQWNASKMILANAIQGTIPFEWNEFRRLCTIPGFKIWPEVLQLVQELKNQALFPPLHWSFDPPY